MRAFLAFGAVFNAMTQIARCCAIMRNIPHWNISLETATKVTLDVGFDPPPGTNEDARGSHTLHDCYLHSKTSAQNRLHYAFLNFFKKFFFIIFYIRRRVKIIPLKIFKKLRKFHNSKLSFYQQSNWSSYFCKIFNSQIRFHLTVSTSYKSKISLLDVVRATGTNRRFQIEGIRPFPTF